MNMSLRPIALVVGLTAVPLALVAHFKLLEPAEWVKTSDLGDPQKAGPCGLPVRAACRTRMETMPSS